MCATAAIRQTLDEMEICRDEKDADGSVKTDSELAGYGVALLLCDEILMFVNRKKSLDGIHLRN
jgi:hypothetical protein